MKKWLYLIIALMAAALTSCADDEFSRDPRANFDALWEIIDEHYTFFEYKDIDWNEVGNRYRAKVTDETTSAELFTICSDMLKELKDGHTNLYSLSDVSRYWIWEQYPVNYDERLIDEHYLHFDYKRTSGIKYAILPDSIGYMRYASFSSNIGASNLDAVLRNLAGTHGLIIDVRSNGGGYLKNVETLVARFITDRIKAGSICHKQGPAHNDFSEPYDYYFDPATKRVQYLDRPIVVLCNRGSFSATNNFVSIMRQLPNATVIGDTTGGGCGLPFTSELPNGWSVRFSAAVIRDANGQITEFGIDPDIKVDLSETDRQAGHDTILDTALATLTSGK